MGKFVAYLSATGQVAPCPASDPDKYSDPAKYYAAMVEEAFPKAFTAAGRGTVWPARPAERCVPLGTIDLSKTGLRRAKGDILEKTMNIIAEQEDKYYYRWEDVEGQPVKVVVTEGSVPVPILVNLVRINFVDYRKLVNDRKLSAVNEAVLFNDIIIKYLQNQDTMLKAGIVPLSRSGQPLILRMQGVSDVLCWVNPQAPALFIDTNESTQEYKYKKVDAVYKKVRTWKPERMNQNLLYAWTTKEKITKDLGQGSLESYPGPKCEENLLQFRQTYLQYEQYSAKRIAAQQAKGKKGLGAGVTSFDDWMRKKTKYRDGLRETYGVEYRDDPAENPEYDGACQIVTSFYCLYYLNSAKELDGFLTNTSFSNPGGRSGGYEMRGDPVAEIEYLWRIVPDRDNDEYKVARALSHLIGLDRRYKLNEGAIPPDVYAETNVPSFPFKLFEYYKAFKTFKSSDDKRNAPLKPARPRVPGRGKVGDKDNKWKNKPTDLYLHKRKKGDKLKGEEWTDTIVRRSIGGAGKVMSNSLSVFQFYDDAMKKDKSKSIKPSSLPATAFTRYVIENDDTAEKQWGKDNPPTDTGSSASLRKVELVTDQEWCHLYGQGDGGQEELENFVAGSKHCNTEQLAIESGQRRISQWTEIPSEVREKLTWKITAYLLPNKGSRTNVPLDDNDKQVNDIFVKVTCISEEDIFDGVSKEIKDGALEKIATKIDELKRSSNTNPSDKDQVEPLVELQRELSARFFIYLPVARWVQYRVFYDGECCFKHLFDAQSQSFDINEARILDYFVEYAIYRAMDKKKTKLKMPETEGEKPALEFYYRRLLGRIRDRFPEAIGVLLTDLVNFEEKTCLNPPKDLSDVDPVNNELTALQTRVVTMLKDLPDQGYYNAASALLADLESALAIRKGELERQAAQRREKKKRKAEGEAGTTEGEPETPDDQPVRQPMKKHRAALTKEQSLLMAQMKSISVASINLLTGAGSPEVPDAVMGDGPTTTSDPVPVATSDEVPDAVMGDGSTT